MNFCITTSQLIELLGARSLNKSGSKNETATGITTDTRNLTPGNLFVALVGEKFDGHNFLEEAIAKGAAAAIVSKQPSLRARELPEIPLLLVEDTLKAYQAIARWWRDRFSIPIVAVTGSVGKTTTKELIAAVLATQGPVLKTEANYNNEIGVPKTLLELSGEHQYAVIEMAMRGQGEIALLTQIARPTVGVIVNVGTAHIGRLGSEEAIAKAKCELLAEMPENSIAILNGDNGRLIETAAGVWSGETLTYGLEAGQFRGELIDARTIKIEGTEIPLPLPGRHNAVNYLAALAVFKVLIGKNLPANSLWESLSQGLSVQLPEGRARRYELANDIVILDETYNAGLESTVAALQLLAETPGKRHIAVLGTMKELGEKSLDFHERVGIVARDLKLDALFILADFEEAKAMAKGAVGLPFLEIENIEDKDCREKLARRLKEFVEPGDRLLFKASHSVQLNRVVEMFKNS
jgi:UDP-N-acetylmuramoyl-tripeptide--D-alanyl-D-alanine ligase